MKLTRDEKIERIERFAEELGKLVKTHSEGIFPEEAEEILAQGLCDEMTRVMARMLFRVNDRPVTPVAIATAITTGPWKATAEKIYRELKAS